MADMVRNLDKIAGSKSGGRLKGRGEVTFGADGSGGSPDMSVNFMEKTGAFLNSDGRVDKLIDVKFEDAGIVTIKGLVGRHTNSAMVLDVIGIKGVGEIGSP